MAQLRRLKSAVASCAIIVSCCAWILGDGISSRTNITTQDGTVSNYPYRLKVTNGSLTDNSDGTMSLSTGGGSNGTVNNGTSGQIAYYAAGGTAVSGNNTFASSITVNSTLQVSTLTTTGGIYNQGYNTVSNSGSNYVITSTDSLVLCNAANNAVTLTLPTASSSNGQILTIEKVDTSVSSCTIKGAGSDQIVSTGTWFLFAQAQQLVIQSTGGVNVWQRAGPMDTAIANVSGDVTLNVGESVATSSNVYCRWTTITTPQRLTGMVYSPSTANGNIDLAIIDTSCNRLASAGTTAMSGASPATVNFTSAINVLPGVYGLCVQISNVTGAIRGLGNTLSKAFFNTETTMGIPALLTCPGSANSLLFGISAVVSGAP